MLGNINCKRDLTKEKVIKRHFVDPKYEAFLTYVQGKMRKTIQDQFIGKLLTT